jgi:hypothetical protein
MTELPFSEHDPFRAFLGKYLKNACQLMPAAAIGGDPFFKEALVRCRSNGCSFGNDIVMLVLNKQFIKLGWLPL